MTNINLLKTFRENEPYIRAVQWREASDNPNNGNNTIDLNNAKEHGGEIDRSISGYNILLQSYAGIHKDQLTTDEDASRKIQKSIKILSNLEEQAKIIPKSAQEQEDRKKKLMEELNATGEAYNLGGFNNHHAIVKYNKENGIWYRTEFNSGLGADVVQNAKPLEYNVTPKGQQTPNVQQIKPVWGVNKQPIISGRLEEVIAADIKNTTLSYSGMNLRAQGLLGDTIEKESVAVMTQKTGNCNTRSTRELLRTTLPTAHFHELYHTTTNLSYEQIAGALGDQSAECSNPDRFIKPKDYGKISELTQATANQDLERMGSLIEQGVNSNATLDTVRLMGTGVGTPRPLFSAKDNDTTQFLLAHGANPNLTDYKGKTPLMHHIQYRNNDAVESLLPNTNINIRDNDGQTAKDLATSRYNTAAKGLIIEREKELNTNLTEAIKNNNFTAISGNINHGGTISSKDALNICAVLKKEAKKDPNKAHLCLEILEKTNAAYHNSLGPNPSLINRLKGYYVDKKYNNAINKLKATTYNESSTINHNATKVSPKQVADTKNNIVQQSTLTIQPSSSKSNDTQNIPRANKTKVKAMIDQFPELAETKSYPVIHNHAPINRKQQKATGQER